jgi:hypothetical protein
LVKVFGDCEDLFDDGNSDKRGNPVVEKLGINRGVEINLLQNSKVDRK